MHLLRNITVGILIAAAWFGAYWRGMPGPQLFLLVGALVAGSAVVLSSRGTAFGRSFFTSVRRGLYETWRIVGHDQQELTRLWALRRTRTTVSLGIAAMAVAIWVIAIRYVPTSQQLPVEIRRLLGCGLPVTIIGAMVLIWLPRRLAAPLLLVASAIWLALPVICELAAPGFTKLAYLIALPLGLVAGSLVAWVEPKWSWLQFRLRGLLVLILAFAGLLAAFDQYLGKPAREQAAAIATIEALGGEVRTDPGFPRWLAPILSSLQSQGFALFIGGRYYREVTALTVRGAHADEILDILPRLGGVHGAAAIHSISLDESSVTDKGLSEIAVCTHLIYLHLANTGISDAGLVHLQECRKLEVLDVSFCPNVTDQSVAVFKRLEKLRSLRVYKTRVTAAGARKMRDALPRCLLPPDGALFREQASPSRNSLAPRPEFRARRTQTNRRT